MAVRRLVGILDDGSDLDPRVPDNARQPLGMTKGSTLTVILQVIRNDGSAVDLTVPPVMVVKRNARQDDNEILVTSTLAPTRGSNYAEFALDAASTKYLEPGRYVYDVWLTQDGSRDAIVPFSTFLLEPGLQLP